MNYINNKISKARLSPCLISVKSGREQLEQLKTALPTLTKVYRLGSHSLVCSNQSISHKASSWLSSGSAARIPLFARSISGKCCETMSLRRDRSRLGDDAYLSDFLGPPHPSIPVSI